MKEKLEEIARTQLFGAWSIGDLLVGGAIAAGIAICLVVLGRCLKGGRPGRHVQTATCPACGWVGHVSRYAGRCPECNARIGDRAARP